MCKQVADTDIHKHLFMGTRTLVLPYKIYIYIAAPVYVMSAVDLHSHSVTY